MMKLRMVAMVGAVCSLAGAAQETSALWGRNGEKWDPVGRLPDVSFAGYACGERPLPEVAAACSVRDFGAKGDGSTDDSDAFLAAIAKTEKGAILIPPGRYRITKILQINKPGIVLRGAGTDKSVLVCPVPLNDIKPDWGATTDGRRTSNYSWSGGIIWFKGTDGGKPVGPVTAPAKRGDHELRVADDTKGLRPGAWIQISVKDDADRSLLDHLYSGDPGDLSKIPAGKHATTFVTRLRSIDGDRLILERPVRIDLRLEWKPQVRVYAPTVTESGIEDLAFEFPAREYGGHFSELGFNAVAFNGVAHCWARNLLVINADSGIYAGGRFCTIDGLRCEMRDVVEADGVFGHHGVGLNGHDNLLTRFDIGQRFIHDITVETGAGNVASSGRGTDLSFDHHKRAPYENVFTDIDLGLGTRMWKCGGGADLGRQCGARGTFWNIRAEKPQRHPGNFGPPSINLVALFTKEKSVTESAGIWFEAIAPGAIHPANLHEAQLRKRLGVK
jgi:hypothetical protein